MIKHSVKFAACFGILSAAVLASDAMAMTTDECEQLSGNMYLAAIERGECGIDIETAAGPQEELFPGDDKDRNHDGRTGGRNSSSGNSDGGGRGNGRPGGPNRP